MDPSTQTPQAECKASSAEHRAPFLIRATVAPGKFNDDLAKNRSSGNIHRQQKRKQYGDHNHKCHCAGASYIGTLINHTNSSISVPKPVESSLHFLHFRACTTQTWLLDCKHVCATHHNQHSAPNTALMLSKQGNKTSSITSPQQAPAYLSVTCNHVLHNKHHTCTLLICHGCM